jgi:hypothetical protein
MLFQGGLIIGLVPWLGRKLTVDCSTRSVGHYRTLLVLKVAGIRKAETTKSSAADVSGFKLYIESLESRGFDTSSSELLKPVLATFNLFHALAGGASSTHPRPYDRVVRIVTEHYGAGPESASRRR